MLSLIEDQTRPSSAIRETCQVELREQHRSRPDSGWECHLRVRCSRSLKRLSRSPTSNGDWQRFLLHPTSGVLSQNAMVLRHNRGTLGTEHFGQ